MTKRRQPAEPHPFAAQKPSLRSEQQSDRHRESQHQDRIFFLQPNSRHHAEPQPIARLIAFHRENCQVEASRPQHHLQIAIRSKQTPARQINRRDQNSQRREHNRKTPAAQLPSDHSSEHDQHRRKHRRHQPDTPQRIPKHAEAEPRQHRQQRRLVHISPRRMIPASDVIELVAEISVAPIGDHMQHKGESGDAQDRRHTLGKKPLSIWWIGSRRVSFHNGGRSNSPWRSSPSREAAEDYSPPRRRLRKNSKTYAQPWKSGPSGPRKPLGMNTGFSPSGRFPPSVPFSPARAPRRNGILSAFHTSACKNSHKMRQ